MLRRTAWPILLLLLLGVQITALMCTVRCGAMAAHAPSTDVHSMADCHHGMQPERAPVISLNHCATHPCSTDLPVMQLRSADEAALSSAGSVALPAAPFAIPLSTNIIGATNSRFLGEPVSPAAFDPLIVSLRV
ncbi:hypothetical protein [Acidipila rosea]|uniref:Uncharacterized protein n=1 Tax=Acidipila rosea TaxID=768535 RepID=A0A4R1L9J8_9BACT|nr:hypothetical protein [Acidipila rosea]TCK74017.1 hypothetical protein C7378_1637 [Acidipila rosea]